MRLPIDNEVLPGDDQQEDEENLDSSKEENVPGVRI